MRLLLLCGDVELMRLRGPLNASEPLGQAKMEFVIEKGSTSRQVLRKQQRLIMQFGTV